MFLTTCWCLPVPPSEKTQLPHLVPPSEETGSTEVQVCDLLLIFLAIVLCVSKTTLQIDSLWKNLVFFLDCALV
jgi:hypothetical protein